MYLLADTFLMKGDIAKLAVAAYKKRKGTLIIVVRRPATVVALPLL
jgi:hypothetical protein